MRFSIFSCSLMCMYTFSSICLLDLCLVVIIYHAFLHTPCCIFIVAWFILQCHARNNTLRFDGLSALKSSCTFTCRRRSRSISPHYHRSRSTSNRYCKSRSPTPRRQRRHRNRTTSVSPVPRSRSPSLASTEGKNAIEKLRKEEEEEKRWFSGFPLVSHAYMMSLVHFYYVL